MSLIKRADPNLQQRVDWPASMLTPWRWFEDLLQDGDGNNLIQVEEFTEGDRLVVRAEIPGINPEKDVQITVSAGMLQISAERSEEESSSGRHFRRHELRYGSFARQIPLPDGVDESAIDASYKDGILEVRIPMPGASTAEPARQIPVTRG